MLWWNFSVFVLSDSWLSALSRVSRSTAWVWGSLHSSRSTSAPSWPTTRPSTAWPTDWPDRALTDKHDTLRTGRHGTPWRGGGGGANLRPAAPHPGSKKKRGISFLVFGVSHCALGVIVLVPPVLPPVPRGRDVYHRGWPEKESRHHQLLRDPPLWDRAPPRNSRRSWWTGRPTRQLQGAREVRHAILRTLHPPLLPHITPRATHRAQQVRYKRYEV